MDSIQNKSNSGYGRSGRKGTGIPELENSLGIPEDCCYLKAYSGLDINQTSLHALDSNSLLICLPGVTRPFFFFRFRHKTIIPLIPELLKPKLDLSGYWPLFNYLSG